jgi:hypothetical protein
MILFILVIIYISLGKESKIKGFPVPFFASYVEDGNQKDYQYSTSGWGYSLCLALNGWRLIEHEGELYIYKKGNREVAVQQPTGLNVLYLYE